MKEIIFLKARSYLPVKANGPSAPPASDPTEGPRRYRASRPLISLPGGLAPGLSSLPHTMTNRPLCMGSSGDQGSLIRDSSDASQKPLFRRYGLLKRLPAHHEGKQNVPALAAGSEVPYSDLQEWTQQFPRACLSSGGQSPIQLSNYPLGHT